jgi:hypothetical protein
MLFLKGAGAQLACNHGLHPLSKLLGALAGPPRLQGGMWHSTAQVIVYAQHSCATVQHDQAAQHGTARHRPHLQPANRSTAQHGTARHGMARHGTGLCAPSDSARQPGTTALSTTPHDAQAAHRLDSVPRSTNWQHNGDTCAAPPSGTCTAVPAVPGSTRRTPGPSCASASSAGGRGRKK